MTSHTEYLLGLDLGASSIGWAVVETRGGQPLRLLRSGVRIFEAGVEGDLEAGRTEPRNVPRRLARQQRRQTDRTRRRLRKVFRTLQKASLLPAGDPHEVIPPLDREIYARHAANLPARHERHRLAQVLPLWLRARALDHPLEPYELGRALFHLAHRRGFLSLRKARPKKDEDEGQLKREISELAAAMASAGARTLGEYLATLDPEEARIRTRKTSRAMYLHEFERIWQAQQPYQPALLSEDLRDAVRHAIFFQRPLKSVARLVGACELEPGRKRAPWALLEAQRFRLLQMLNNTRIIDLRTGEERPLSPQERSILLTHLERADSLTFANAKKLLGRTGRDLRFNLEEGGEKRFLGNRTAAALATIFGRRWWDLSPAEQHQVVTDVLTIDGEAALARRGREHWRLSPEAADALAVLSLEQGYCSFSRAALGKLLPLLEQGMPLATACGLAYPGRRAAKEPLDRLPPVGAAVPSLRNPVVARVLTELRKVVNALLREHGKPSVVRIELAREVKRANRARKKAAERMQQQQRRRAEALKRLQREVGIDRPSRTDIDKLLLWEECGGQCPYTGRAISFAGLFGSNPEFDIEHIIPFHRSFDNSFANRTLCHVDENRKVKGNRTPWEAYGGTPRYEEILQRVRAFRGDKAREKLRRFQLQEIDSFEDFTSRELNDTRWASRLAADYVALLFGGRVDEDDSLRVQTLTGQLTAYLRGALGLNGLLSSNDHKTRDDHRQHAVDAIVAALTTPSLVKRLADAAEHTWAQRRRLFSDIDPPWPDFRDGVASLLASMVVSHRPQRKVTGALHEETIYGRRLSTGQAVVRKEVHSLSKGELAGIVDPIVRAAVQAKVKQLGDVKKLEHDPPLLPSRRGRPVPIRRVRIARSERLVAVGDGPRRRLVKEGSNHHIEIIAKLDARGNETRWFGRVVSTLEANRRLRAEPPQPVVDRRCGRDQRFKFSLCRGDAVVLSRHGREELWLVQKIWAERGGSTPVVLKSPIDARPVSKIPQEGRKFSPNTLRTHSARKVTVDPLGTIRDARD